MKHNQIFKKHKNIAVSPDFKRLLKNIPILNKSLQTFEMEGRSWQIEVKS